MHPTRFLLVLALLPALLSLGLAVDGSWWPMLLALDGALLLVALLDLALIVRVGRVLRVEAACTGTWSLGRPEPVTYQVDHLARMPRRVRLLPDLPVGFRAEEGVQELELPGRTRAEVAFRIVPGGRGAFSLCGLHLAVPSRLGLWHRHLHLGDELVVHVYPDLKQLAEFDLLARTERLALIGVRRSRRVGGDTEFERLRDRHSDDPLNRMDWKATARRDVLTVRDYRTSQAQRIILMVDAGRMMVSTAKRPDGVERSLLDQAIEAALMLAWVAARQGDSVGLVAYSDGVKRWVPPRSGQRQVNLLIHALHDLHCERVESRHEDAFLHLERSERKRSLVVLLTHVLDEVNADHLERHARQLTGRYLPLVALLQDGDLHRLAPEAAAPPDTADLWRAGAAAAILNQRGELIERLRRAGALVVDSPAERLTPDLVSRYLEVKARHLL